MQHSSNKETSEIEEDEGELSSRFATKKARDQFSRNKSTSQILANNHNRTLSNSRKSDNIRKDERTINIKAEATQDKDQSFEEEKVEKQLEFKNETLSTEENKTVSQMLKQKMEEMRTNVSQSEKDLEVRYVVNEPILLLNIDDSGKILLNKKALTMLKHIKTNIACISVVGPYRTGKSFLLNRFLGNFFSCSFYKKTLKLINKMSFFLLFSSFSLFYSFKYLILGTQNGFEIGPSTNPCTKGIWIWGKPLKFDENLSIILIDTEGLGIYKQI